MKKLLVTLLMICLLASTTLVGATEDYSETGALNILWYQNGGAPSKFECTYFDWMSTVLDLLYDTLIKLDMEDTTKIVPRMADTYEISEDGLVYKFHIRDGLTWTDGEPVTGDDVVFSLEAQIAGFGVNNERGSFAYIDGAEEFAKGEADSIAGVSADGNDVTITLKTPYGYFMRTMATFVPYPRHLFPEDVDYSKFESYDYWLHPIHCGPYVLESVAFPDNCVLVRNEDWYGERPGIKTIHGLNFNTGGVDAASAAMIAGQLDMVHSNEYNDINIAENVTSQNPDYGYSIYAASYFRLFACNTKGSSQDGKYNPFMLEKELRQAINCAIDKTAVASYFPGQGVALSTKINPGDPMYNQEIPLFERDVEKAKELLASIGYDGTPLRIGYYYQDQTTADLMDLVVQNLSEVGIPAEATLILDGEAIYGLTNWDILYCGLNSMSGVENYMQDSTGVGTDEFQGFVAERDEYFTSLYNEALTTSDPVRLQEIANQLQVNDLEWRFNIPVLSMNKVMIYNDAKWDFDPAWETGTDLSIYRTIDLRLHTWSLNAP